MGSMVATGDGLRAQFLMHVHLTESSIQLFKFKLYNVLVVCSMEGIIFIKLMLLPDLQSGICYAHVSDLTVFQ